MRKALVVASRELRERWLLLAAAPICGCFPLVLPAFGTKQQDVLLLVGSVGAFSFAAAAAVVTGTTMLARDTAEGRLAFLFTRPLSWVEIWGGKWLAALVLVLGCGLLCSLPWMLVYPPLDSVHASWFGVFSDLRIAQLLVVTALVAIGAVNLLATLYRERSAFLALDVVLLLTTVWALARYVAPLFALGFVNGAWTTRLAFDGPPMLVLLPLAAALLLGSALQLAYGRTDLRRAHRALSAGFWSVIATGLVVAAGFVVWIEAAGPQDLTATWAVRGSADGRWLSVRGRTNRGGWYEAGFLVDTSSGRYVATTDLDWASHLSSDDWPSEATISNDGRYGLRAVLSGGGTALELLDLATTPPRRTKVQLEKSTPPTWFTMSTLSPSGNEAVVVQESSISLYALPSGKSIISSPLSPNWHVSAVRFRGEDARAWIMKNHPGMARPQEPSELRVVELLASGRTESRAFTAAAGLRLFGEVVPDAAGERLLTLDGGLRLRNAADGAPLLALFEGEAQGARFLPDGGVVALQVSRERQVLHAYGPDGREQRAIDLGAPTVNGPRLGPDAGPGRVIVQTGTSYNHVESVVVDLASGGVVQRLPGLAPATWRWWISDLFDSTRLPGLFTDEQGRLLRLDFATGQRQVLAGAGGPRGERIARF